MLSIRLSRQGAKKRPFYQITVAERSAGRDGRFIERIGFFEPVAAGRSQRLRLDLERADYWLARGAQPTERVHRLIKDARRQAAPPESPSGEDEAAA